MKIKLLIIITVLLTKSLYAQSLYEIDIPLLQQGSLSVKNMANQKLMFIVLPIKQDTVFIQLRQFAKQNRGSIKIIGLLAIENEFDKTQTSKVISMYEEMGIILSTGLHTGKDTKEPADPILAWLKDRKRNSFFSCEEIFVGSKFFVDEKGKLFGVFGPETPLDHAIISDVLKYSANTIDKDIF